MENIKCFEIGLAALLDASLWVKWLSILANMATILAVIVAFVAARIAYHQFLSTKEESRHATASGIYHQYLLLCIEKCHFSYGMTKPPERNQLYGEYCWFISSMLFAFEQILEAQPNDQKWKNTIRSQLNIHKEFLKNSRTVKDEEWTHELQDLISEVIGSD